MTSAAISANTLRRRATQREASKAERDILEAVKQKLQSIVSAASKTVLCEFKGEFKAEIQETADFELTLFVSSKATGVVLSLPIWKLGRAQLSIDDCAVLTGKLPFIIWRALYNMPTKSMSELRALKLPEKWRLPASV